jgi:signal transduction histidine kinase
MRFPLRIKILTTLLLVVTIVVSLITFIMAKLFHTDKTAYIHDLTSVIALHTAQEARSLLTGYEERLKVFTGLLSEQSLMKDQKAEMLKHLFEDFPEFVAVSLYERGNELVTVYDAKTLEGAGLTKDDLSVFRRENPLPFSSIEAGNIFLQNSTVSGKLPSLTLAISPTSGGEKTIVVAAVIRLQSLLHMAQRSRVFETFIVDSQGTFLAHSDTNQAISHSRADWIPKLRNLQEQQSLGTTSEYDQNGVRMVGGFAQVDFGGLLAGVQIPKAAAYLTARELLFNLIIVSLILLIASAFMSHFWSRLITRPIERLSHAATAVGKGQFDIHVERTTRDEIGDLAESFNQMASELDTREKALKEAQAALIQSEKMAAFGQLGAGIAHEVKNPLAGILGFAQLSLRKVEKDSPLHKNLLTIEKETKRCKVIIENLLKFARQEKMAFEFIEINSVVQDAMAIVDHQLGLQKVRLETEFASGLPRIMGNANQIQQVLLNLMINAQQAMNSEPGLVRISTRMMDSKEVEIRVSDTGSGIPKEIQSKIFEPFFTTKPTGKGTGLGLSVSYGIVKDHKGNISVESEMGKGTTFVIVFPVPSPNAGSEISGNR